MTLFSRLYPSFGYLGKIFPPRGLKYSLLLYMYLENLGKRKKSWIIFTKDINLYFICQNKNDLHVEDVSFSFFFFWRLWQFIDAIYSIDVLIMTKHFWAYDKNWYIIYATEWSVRRLLVNKSIVITELNLCKWHNKCHLSIWCNSFQWNWAPAGSDVCQWSGNFIICSHNLWMGTFYWNKNKHWLFHTYVVHCWSSISF